MEKSYRAFLFHPIFHFENSNCHLVANQIASAS